MKAVRIARTGGPEVLEFTDVPEPKAGPGELLVRHEAVGLNFIDVYQRTGLYPVPLPATLGLEAAGVVEAVGEGVEGFAPGDRVAYNGSPGAYAEANAVKAARTVKLPDAISTRDAAAVLLKGMTAELLARRLRTLKPGAWALVHAAAGGVGAILCPWLASLGVRVIGVVGSAEKAQRVLANGCEAALVYADGDVAAKARELTGGKGVEVVYDSVGKDTVDMSLASLARRGLFVSFGNASGPARAIAPLELSKGGSLTLTRASLFDYVATPQELADSAAALFHVIESGAVKVEIGQTFPLSRAREAHEALEGRRTTGSTLLLP